MPVDSYLGVQIANTYTATPLQQLSIVLKEDFSNTLTITDDSSILGEWTFIASACEFSTLTQTYECSNGQ